MPAMQKMAEHQNISRNKKNSVKCFNFKWKIILPLLVVSTQKTIQVLRMPQPNKKKVVVSYSQA